jgi:hypothetical protein
MVDKTVEKSKIDIKMALGKSRATHERKNTNPKKKGSAFVWKESCRMSYVASPQDV